MSPATLPLQSAAPLAELPARGAPGFGVWRYGACIPVAPYRAAPITLGEGGTPLVRAGDTGASDGVTPDPLARVFLKLEFVSPTGSFKDRGAAVLVASAVEREARQLVADSSGNAGSAIAAYAARAGLPCRVFVPGATSSAKRAQIRAFGAELELVDGDRTATAERAEQAVRDTGAFYASHVHDPHFLQGTKTFAFEIWEQLGAAPSALILPAGNGTLLLGAAIGFAELQAAGLIARMPTVIAAQAEHCAPLVEGWRAGAEHPAEIEARATQAEGIAIPRPARGEEMLRAVRDSGGTVVSVPEEAIDPARADLARRGLLVEPTAAVAWAAALLALEPHRLGAPPELAEADEWVHTRSLLEGAVVVPLSGSGLKNAAMAPAG